MECPSCGWRVSAGAASCALCGMSMQPAEVAVVGMGEVRRASLALAVAPVGAMALPMVVERLRCSRCGSELEAEGASFCSDCGAPVAEPIEEVIEIVPEAEAAEEEELDESSTETIEVPALAGVTVPDVEGETSVVPEQVFLQPRASRPQRQGPPDPEPSFVVDREPQMPFRPADPFRAGEIVEVGPIRANEQASSNASVEPPSPSVVESGHRQDEPLLALGPEHLRAAVVGFAVIALLAALGTQMFGPSEAPGFTRAELDLKLQMRAVEWLLAGILVSLAGLVMSRR